MSTRRIRCTCAAVAAVGLAPAASGGWGLIDFEDLVPGTQYVHDDVFGSGGWDLGVETFYWSNGTPYDGGYAEVENGGLAGRTGNELHLNNVNIDISSIVGPFPAIELYFGEYGGNVNLSVNGELVNVENFDELPPTIGGIGVGWTDLGGGLGRITAGGPDFISQFSIGGQELWIDDVAILPGPGALALLALAAAAPRRRR